MDLGKFVLKFYVQMCMQRVNRVSPVWKTSKSHNFVLNIICLFVSCPVSETKIYYTEIMKCYETVTIKTINERKERKKQRIRKRKQNEK